MSEQNKTYDPSKGEMPPINVKGQKGRVVPQKSAWQKAKEKASAIGANVDDRMAPDSKKRKAKATDLIPKWMGGSGKAYEFDGGD